MSNKIDFLNQSAQSNTDQCIEWPFKRDKDGYGWHTYLGEKRAHRVMYAAVHGKIPEGVCVMHSCDNPSCINPRHLSLGTHSENMRDRENKGRGVKISFDNKGEKHGKAILTEQSVLEIRKIYETKRKSQKELASLFGVARSTIGDIIKRVTWSHV